jgi:hypothetical protein
MLNGWQHKGSFVIKFRAETDPDAGRFYGRIEHVSSGQIACFDSLEELSEFLQCVLRTVRLEFTKADRLAGNGESTTMKDGNNETQVSDNSKR